MKRIFLVIVLILLFPNIVKAYSFGCDYNEKARLTTIASNINVDIDYIEKNGSVEFVVILNNLHPELYIIDTSTNKEYRYNDKKEIKISGYKDGQSIIYEVHSTKDICSDTLLLNKYATFLHYNKYYNDSLCEGLSDFYLCKKWVNNDYSYDNFAKEINKYLKSKEQNGKSDIDLDGENWLMKFLKENYIYVIIGTLIVVILLGLFIKNQTKNKLKL